MDVIDAEWIRARLTGEHGEQARLAAKMGISPDKLTKILKGVRRVQANEIPGAIAFFGDRGLEAVEVQEGAPAPQGSSLVPVHDVSASAGHGGFVDTEQVIYSLAFPPEYLARLTSSRPENLSIISVKGDSMEPTILDDDIVMLDRSKTNLAYDGLFALRFDDALHVKRVGRSGRRGHVTIISDNRDLYPPFEATASDIIAVGKVLWYGRRV